MKIKKLAILISGIAIIAAIGGTYAAFVASSDPITKDVTAPELGIMISQRIDENELQTGSVTQTENGLLYTGGVPGSTIPQKVNVVSADRSTDCYVRVALYRSWWSKDGTEKITDADKADPREIAVETLSKEDWIIQEPEDDTEVIYFYYKKPIASGQETSNLMDSFTILKESIKKNSNAYANLGVQIEFEADAVQKVAAKDAMLAEWGVIAEFDGDKLAGVTEQ